MTLESTVLDTGAEPRFMDSADVDGDGDLDLVVPIQGDNELILIENTDGNGTLAIAATLATGLEGVERVGFGDLDGDNDLDLVANVDTAGQVVWLENTDGAGTFSDVKIVSADTEQASGLSIVDIDADGDLDIMTSSQFAAKVSKHVNDGSGNFVTTEITPPNAIEPQLVLLADLDGDGDQDAIGQSEFDYELAWYENLDGQGNFGEQNMIVDYDYPPATTPTVWWDIETGDLDGDGDIDIITSEPNFADKIVWYENDGTGNFTVHKYTGVDEAGDDVLALELEIHDLDGDGDNDIVANSYFFYSGGIVWFENTDGNGTLDYKPLIEIDGHALGELTLGDIDGDGDLDVLVGDNNQNTTSSVAWYENVDGVFDEVQILKIDQANVDDVRLADMDNDGDLDAVTAAYPDDQTDSMIEWFENTDGKGTFNEMGTLIGDQFVVFDLHIEDIDGDSDLDVLGNGLFEGFVEVFENDGGGVFTNEYTVNSDQIPNISSQFDVGDVNGDGRLDVVIGKGDDNAYVWFMNEGAGGSPFDVDMDGDTDSDDAITLCGAIRTGSDDLKFDLNNDGEVTNIDMVVMMRDGLNSSVGDSNFDGVFGTGDLVLVFTAGEYEDGVPGNSTWVTGDWNCDGDFTTGDLVFVFQNGTYNGAAAVPAGNDVAAAADTVDNQIEDVERADNIQLPVADNRVQQVAAKLDAAHVDQVFDNLRLRKFKARRDNGMSFDV